MNQVISINRAKTSCAVALILQLHQKPMILDRLMKMMYFIDRLYLAQANQSLTNDSYDLTKTGLMPHQMPSLIAELINSGKLTTSQVGDGYIALNHCFDSSNLNELETKIITHIYLQKRAINPCNFLDWNYDLDFLQQHTKKQGHTLVTPIHMLLGLNKTKAEILAYINFQKDQESSLVDSANLTKVAKLAGVAL